jgi:hypothetical protein
MPSKTPLFLFFALLLAFNSFAQEQVAVELMEAKILYRGYRNLIFVPQDSCQGFVTDVVVISNGTIEKGDKPGEYVVLPGNLRYTKLAIIRRTRDGISDTLRIAEFRARNLPAPQLYWGPYESGMVVRSVENLLFAKFGDDIFLTASFNIISWTFYIGDKSVSGTGRNVALVKDYFKNLSSPTKVIVVAKVIGPDNREHEIQGDWVVMPGASLDSKPHIDSPCVIGE